jgi:membrane protease YdiL (CAAX protease family)
MAENTHFWQRWRVLFGAGAIGVVAILPMMAPVLRDKLATVPGAPPLPVLLVLSTLQTLVMLALAVAVGVRFAPELNLRSHLAEWAATRTPLLPALRREVGLSLAVGVLALLVTAAIDLMVFRAQLPVATWEALQKAGSHVKPGVVLAGLLYGGITEELLLRWALMTILAWGVLRVSHHQNLAMWSAIILSSLAFGAGHLGATALVVPLTPMLIVRALTLNFIVGVACGWLYWKRSLEAAMMAHMAWHLAATALSQLPFFNR